MVLQLGLNGGYLTSHGAQHVDFSLPNRFEFGYGLTPELVHQAAQAYAPQLLITVDNGISSVEGSKPRTL